VDLDRTLRAAPTSRRSFLGALGLTGAAALLAACDGRARVSPTPSPTAGSPTPSPTGGASVEGSLFMYGWPAAVNPDNVDLFKERFDVSTFRYDEVADSTELIARLRDDPARHDVAATGAEHVPALVKEGLIQALDPARIPNRAFIDPRFRGLASDPTDAYQVPKDYGTTGIVYRGQLVREPLASWREFRDLVTSDRYSGRTVFVNSMTDVLAFALKLTGKSVNSVAADDLAEARTVLLAVAPHLLALDSVGYGERLRSGEAVLCLGWTGPLASLRADPAARDTVYVVPREGTLLWLDTWVLIAGAPHPNAGYAWLNFIHEPEVQGNETNYTSYATPNDRALAFVDPELLADPAVFPPEATFGGLEAATDTSGNAQRIDIWKEFSAKVGAG